MGPDVERPFGPQTGFTIQPGKIYRESTFVIEGLTGRASEGAPPMAIDQLVGQVVYGSVSHAPVILLSLSSIATRPACCPSTDRPEAF